MGCRLLLTIPTQFVYTYDAGCLSYEFYPEPGTNAPRCNLYGSNVKNSLQSVDANVWYDLGVAFLLSGAGFGTTEGQMNKGALYEGVLMGSRKRLVEKYI